MTIRQAAPADASKVAALILLAIKDIGYQLTGEQDELNVLKQLEQFYLTEGNRFSSSLILVKEINRDIAGMILCYHGSKASQLYRPILEHLRKSTGVNAPQIDQEADEDEYYIDALAVSPAYQGKGYAKELFAAAERYAVEAQYSKIALVVDQANESAYRLYQKLGYEADKEILIHHRPYRHMIKRLSIAQPQL